MKKLLSTLVLALGLISLANAAGLSGGDQFSAQNIEGNLQVQCSGNGPGPTFGSAFCQAQILNPGEYSYFVGPKMDADQVTLQATREDGSVSKAKTEKYDGTTGKSKSPFNLWIRTVLQRPLLGMGKNTVAYTLLKNGNKVDHGTFTVEVVNGGNAVCHRMGYYTSASTNDCNMPETFCSQYFSENNYCQ